MKIKNYENKLPQPIFGGTRYAMVPMYQVPIRPICDQAHMSVFQLFKTTLQFHAIYYIFGGSLLIYR